MQPFRQTPSMTLPGGRTSSLRDEPSVIVSLISLSPRLEIVAAAATEVVRRVAIVQTVKTRSFVRPLPRSRQNVNLLLLLRCLFGRSLFRGFLRSFCSFSHFRSSFRLNVDRRRNVRRPNSSRVVADIDKFQTDAQTKFDVWYYRKFR